jgi:hypothetical protein
MVAETMKTIGEEVKQMIAAGQKSSGYSSGTMVLQRRMWPK